MIEHEEDFHERREALFNGEIDTYAKSVQLTDQFDEFVDDVVEVTEAAAVIVTTE